MRFLSLWGYYYFGRGSPAASIHQIDRSPHFEQGIGGGGDPIDTGDGVEDDLLLLVVAVGNGSGKRDGSQFKLSAVLGPVDRGIIHDVAGVGQLYQDFEFDRALCHSRGELVEEEVCTLFSDSGVVQMLDTGFGDDPVAAKSIRTVPSKLSPTPGMLYKRIKL